MDFWRCSYLLRVVIMHARHHFPGLRIYPKSMAVVSFLSWLHGTSMEAIEETMVSQSHRFMFGKSLPPDPEILKSTFLHVLFSQEVNSSTRGLSKRSSDFQVFIPHQKRPHWELKAHMSSEKDCSFTLVYTLLRDRRHQMSWTSWLNLRYLWRAASDSELHSFRAKPLWNCITVPIPPCPILFSLLPHRCWPKEYSSNPLLENLPFNIYLLGNPNDDRYHWSQFPLQKHFPNPLPCISQATS